MSDLRNELELITSRLSEKLQALETEHQRWQDYKTDYDALENQLKTLPDNTTRSAMIPLGKLAFMPGKLIHTNEILVLLGEQYYAERSAKQAVEILKRRREVVNENLQAVEAQLNSFKQKTGTIMGASNALPINEAQVNEEGLPIMDIREELPSNYDEEQLKKKKLLEQKKSSSKPTNQLPESVLRARAMMKEADEKIKKKKQLEQDAENKALFELLRELEEEEEEAQEEVLAPVMSKFEPPKQNDDDDDDDNSSFEDDEDDDRYDTEISENMFDRFGDDEQYPLDGTVDQEDFTCYDELPPQVPTATITELVEENERSTPKLITKRKSKPQPIVPESPVEEPKKMSKFKLAQQENKSLTAVDESSESKPKKFSKFKLLRQQQQQQQQQQDQQPRKPVDIKPVVETKVKEVVQETKPQPAKEQQQQPTEEQLSESFESMMIEPKKKSNVPVENNGIPKVVAKPKKMSRFKLARQKQEKAEEVATDELDAPLKVERIKPKRSVTWDANNSVRDHDNTLAPSVVSETQSYSQPMKKEETKMSLHQQIKSASNIYRTIQNTQNNYVDDYPSLEDQSDTQIDLNELIKAARNSSEAFWSPNDGTEALIPMVRQVSDDDEDDGDDEENDQKGIIVAKKNKLDNKIMKGAVTEREIAPVDLEAVEEDMDMREITSNYQQLRQNMLASTGGFSFATKPEFEVFDEELPLPKKKNDPQEEEIEIAPKKMSRFKAARLGMRMQNEEEEYQ